MLELMIHLDSDSGKPLYEQIYDHIRIHIADGKISCGEKLPSTRLLSGYLQVSRSTVELAYEQLLSEGYIESQPGRGYYAGDLSGLYLSGQKEPATEKPADIGLTFLLMKMNISIFPIMHGGKFQKNCWQWMILLCFVWERQQENWN